MNDAAGKLTGWEEKVVIGKVISDVFNISNNDHQQNITDIIHTVLGTGKMVEHANNNNILISKNGVEYHIADSITPLKDAENNMLGAVIVFRDITAHLRREDEQLKANKLESIGVLAGGIAHDFNNILTGIFGNLEFAKAQLSPTHKAYNFIITACQAMERATGLTKQLLTFAKGGDPIIKPLDVKKIILDAIDFNLGGSNIKAKLNLPDRLWKINADKGQLNQVLANLIINAKHAMPAGGIIKIEAENITNPAIANLTGNFVMLKIQDNGVGIPEKYMKQIFDPYFKTKHNGNGLGLATTHSIIRRHHGHIMVEASKDSGTCFTIYLPAEKITEQLDSVTPITKKQPKKATGRILIMDDEVMIQEVSATILTSCGYQVELATDGAAALKAYRAAMGKGSPFDLVIMDLTIPGGMGGKDAIKKLLELDPAAKVIASSGYSTDPIIANYTKYGFKGRLIKPFRLDALQAEVDRILNEA
jgi:PAS domain S-box-containing protein